MNKIEVSKDAVHNILVDNGFFNRLTVKPKADIIDWVDDNLHLSLERTGYHTGKDRLYQDQIEILRESENPKYHTQIVMAVPRLGKSTVWKMILLYRSCNRPQTAMIIYPSDDKAEETNNGTVLPLMHGVPELKQSLNRPRAVRADRITLQDNIIYFQGAGKSVVSTNVGMAIGDECDCWPPLPDTTTDNISNLKIRTANYPIGERLIYLCSSPTDRNTIFDQWDQSSRGVYSWACLHCGKLWPCNRIAYPMGLAADGNAKWAGLQGFAGDNWTEADIRWICPGCGHSHRFQDAQAMADAGAYVHTDPANPVRGYQIGALARPSVYSWGDIARAYKAAKIGKTLNDQLEYSFNVLGMPYKNQISVTAGEDDVFIQKIKSHVVPIDDNLIKSIKYVLAGIDVQGYKTNRENDNYYVYTVRGYDDNGVSYLLDFSDKLKPEELEDFIEHKTYLGLNILCGIIDQGGFSHDDKDDIVLNNNHIWYYKGDTKAGEIKSGNVNYVINKQSKLILVNPYKYQSDLLYDMHHAKGVNYKIATDIDTDKTYINQTSCMQPDKKCKKGDGNDYRNWDKKRTNDRRDMFDADKMIYVLNRVIKDYAIKVDATRYRDGIKDKDAEAVKQKNIRNALGFLSL